MTYPAIWIKLGDALPHQCPFCKDDVLIRIEENDVIGVWANSRAGKTTLIKMLLLDIYRRIGRNFIAFDMYSDDMQRMLLHNPDAKRSYQLIENKDVFVIKNFALSISQFNSVADWVSLEFPDMAQKIVTKLARAKELHKDDPEKFEQLLGSLPAKYEELKAWNNELGKKLPLTAVYTKMTIDSALRRFDLIRHLFKAPNDKKLFISDFGDYYKKLNGKNLIISLDLQHEDLTKMRSYFAIIMRQISRCLKNSIIFVDETDKLAPAHSLVPLTSTAILIEFAIKLRRLGLTLILASQDDRLVAAALHEHTSKEIIGRLSGDNFKSMYTQNLYIDRVHNIRQFVLKDENNYIHPFQVEVSKTL